MRRSVELVYHALCLITGWYWFGASGVALAALWVHAGKSDRGSNCRDAVLPDEVTFVHITPLKVTLGIGRWPYPKRMEVYRDEVTPAQWARIRRLYLNPGELGAQPATGRSTSS